MKRISLNQSRWRNAALSSVLCTFCWTLVMPPLLVVAADPNDDPAVDAAHREARPEADARRKAGRAPDAVDFGRQVYPLLRRACFECHGPEKQEGDLRLDRRDETFDSGAVVAGDPESSELIHRISLKRGEEGVMPAIGRPLRREEISVLRNWVAQGAIWPDEFKTAPHWAYVPPARPALPPIQKQGWPRNPIDHFTLQQMERQELEPSPPARPEVLLRRVYLDIIGIPPSPKEVDAFLADPSDKAFENVVDELLARDQFGERWARPWLDLARYADSHGFQRDNFRDVWAYRDWVIRALNADMPFDQFTIEQVAGDLLPNATESQKIATGFHRCTPTNVEAGSLPEETRTEQVIDRVNTTGAVWLGSTLECAQCHDHKYDPFSMRDYYRLLAFFNSTEAEADRTDPRKPSSIAFKGPSMPLSDAAKDAQRKELQQQLDATRNQQTERRRKLVQDLQFWAKQLAEEASKTARTHVLEVVHFESQGATDSHEVLDDGSILLVGADPPDKDVYTVRVRASNNDIRGIRLDALRDDRLPGNGPGRGDTKRTNFVLNELTVTRSDEPLQLTKATANFSQSGWDVGGAIDGDPKSGWAIAPKFGQPHWARFLLKEPLDAGEGVELTVRLVQQYGGSRSIGRFRLSAITGDVDAPAIPDAVVKAANMPSKKWSRSHRKQLLDYRVQRDAESKQLAAQQTKLEKQIRGIAADTTLVMVELEQMRPTHLFERGDYRQPGEQLEPGTPEQLHPLPEGSAEGPANRLTLARWLVDRNNPLVARVTVNRWWAELFGQGIVATVEDFGIKGDSPTHPQLLDWLAVEFMDHNWSMKHVLRAIVLSSTYRQASRVTAQRWQIDPSNRLLARGPRFRMDAEMIRDNALAVSGLLNLKQFGPPIKPFQPDGIWSKVGGTSYKYVVSPGAEQHRRGIYVVLKRGAPYPSFVNFDGSARLSCTVNRSRTNTPLQALNLLNDPVYVEAARALARRVLADLPKAERREQLSYAFRLCTARRPDPDELETLEKLFKDQKTASRERSQDATTLRAGEKTAVDVTDAEFAAWYAVATTLLNLHETITKH